MNEKGIKEWELISERLAQGRAPQILDADNSVRLTYKQTTSELDPMLAGSGCLRRNPKIGCIVKVFSSICSRIRQMMDGHDMFCLEKTGRTINIFNLKCDPAEARALMEQDMGMTRAGNIGVIFRILNVENILESEHVERFHISFAKTYTSSKPREILLPRPHSDLKSFRIWGKSMSDIDQKAQTLYDYLSFIYGSGNVETSLIYDYSIPRLAASPEMSPSEWECLESELQSLSFEASTGANADGSFIYFDFEDIRELRAKLEELQKIGIFEIAKSPLDDDFKFKIKIEQAGNPGEQDV